MKKCASCTKDLPDAALHCVFCGAKQPPAPASQPTAARTVMGYGNEELDKLRAQASAANAARQGAPSGSPSNVQTARSDAPAMNQPPHVSQPSQPPPPSGYAAGGLAPVAAVNAATMFVDGPPPGVLAATAQRSHSPSQSPPLNPIAGAYNIGAPQPSPYAPSPPARPPAPAPTPVPFAAHPQPSGGPSVQVAPAPYLAPGKAAVGARPIEPWKESLRTQMFLWGALLLVAFGVPLAIEPALTGNWDIVLHAPGSAKLIPLILAAVGFLAIVVGSIPMEPGARGMIALLLGLSGILVPIVLAIVHAPEGANVADWHLLVPLVGVMLLVPGLLLRAEYRDSIAPRIMVTLGVLAVLTQYLVPIGGSVPFVALIQNTFTGEIAGKGIIRFALDVLPVILCVLSLLVWLPAPSTAGAKVIAWLFILLPLIGHLVALFVFGDPSMITKAPNAALVSWVPETGYLALLSYGLASVVGKQLE